LLRALLEMPAPILMLLPVDFFIFTLPHPSPTLARRVTAEQAAGRR
jgi:hypothetical protein